MCVEVVRGCLERRGSQRLKGWRYADGLRQENDEPT
jgi:hypothetical protein